MRYKILWSQGDKITSKDFDDPDLSKILSSFSVDRYLGWMDSAFLFRDDECIAFTEDEVYSTIMGLLFEHHINTQGTK